MGLRAGEVERIGVESELSGDGFFLTNKGFLQQQSADIHDTATVELVGRLMREQMSRRDSRSERQGHPLFRKKKNLNS